MIGLVKKLYRAGQFSGLGSHNRTSGGEVVCTGGEGRSETAFVPGLDLLAFKRIGKQANATGSAGRYFCKKVKRIRVFKAPSKAQVSVGNLSYASQSDRTNNVVQEDVKALAVAAVLSPSAGSPVSGFASSMASMLLKQSIYCMLLLSTVVRESMNNTAMCSFAGLRALSSIYRIARSGFLLEHLLLASGMTHPSSGIDVLNSRLAQGELTQVLRMIGDTSAFLDAESKQFLGRFVLSVYVPIARRFKLKALVESLEEAALLLIDPVGYSQVRSMVRKVVQKHGNVFAGVTEKITSFVSDLPQKVQIESRVKSASSVYLKMKGKGKDFLQVRDLFAARIIVHTAPGERSGDDLCRAVLDKLRSSFTMDEEFGKDYISNPKPNGYRGLHAMLLHGGSHMEIQIRTAEMHQTAEHGSACHWEYKASSFPPAVDLSLAKQSAVIFANN